MPRALGARRPLPLVVLALALGGAVGPASALRGADEVILRDGTRLTGEVLSEDGDRVRIAVRRGEQRAVLELPAEQVRLVRRLSDEHERLARRAEEALLAGDHARAIAALSDLVARRAEDPRAQRELGFALLLANQPERAVAPLRAACALDPDDLEAHLSLARALEETDALDEALAVVRRATLLGPRHTATWRLLARLHLERGEGGDRAAAWTALRQARHEAPQDEEVVLELATALLQGGDDALREARALLAAHVGEAPDALRALGLLAQLDAAAGDYSDAFARLDQLLGRAERPGGALPPPVRDAFEAERALYGWLRDGALGFAPPALDAGERGTDLARARRHLDLLLELLPDDGRLQLALARVELRAARHGVARAWLAGAAQAGPPEVTADALLLDEVVAELMRAELLPGAAPPDVFLGDVTSAAADRLVALAPWLVGAHRTLARACLRAGRFAEAAAAYEAALPHAADEQARGALRAEAAAARELARRAERHRDL